MLPAQSCYLVLQLAILLLVFTIVDGAFDLKKLRTRRLWGTVFGLYVLWLALDQVAVALGLWSFPIDGGTFPYRLLGLPLEEHLIFITHTLVCFSLLQLYFADK